LNAESLYFHIAKGAIEEACSGTYELKLAQKIVTDLVFSALCLESFIPKQYIKHEQAKKFIKDVDSMKLALKWLMIPLFLV